MIKVNKLAIFKMVREVGLTPIEDSWNVEVERIHNYYHGDSSTTTYYLDTLEDVSISVIKDSGDEPNIDISHSIKNTKVAVENLRLLFAKYGYRYCDIRLSQDGEKPEIIKTALKKAYNEDLDKIIEILKPYIDEVIA